MELFLTMKQKLAAIFFYEISARDVVLETLRYGQKVDFGLKGEIATVTQEKKNTACVAKFENQPGNAVRVV